MQGKPPVFCIDLFTDANETFFQGKLVRKLCDLFPVIKNVINYAVLSKHQIALEDLPSWDSEDGRECARYRAVLSRDFITWGAGDVHTIESLMPEQRGELMDTEDADSEPVDETPYMDVSVDQKTTIEDNLVCVPNLESRLSANPMSMNRVVLLKKP